MRPLSNPPGSATRPDRALTLALALTIVAWASAFAAIRAGLAGYGPVELAALRFAIAAVPAFLYLLWARPPLPALQELWRFVAGGFLFVALYAVLLNIGEQTVSAGPASFIVNVNPIITALLAMAVLKETFDARAWLGTAVSFAGIGLIAAGEGADMKVGAGAILILGAALATAVNTVIQKPLFGRYDPLTVAAWNMILGALFLLPALPSALMQSLAASPQALFAAVYLGIVPGLVAYGTWAFVLSRMSASRASNFLYCVPPVATALGYLWLGEKPSALGVTGGALALLGVVLVNYSRAATARL